MIGALIRPVFQIIKRPQLLIPAFVAGLLIYLITENLFILLAEVIYRTVVLNEIPLSGPFELPVLLAGKYALNLLMIGAYLFAFNLVTAEIIFMYSRYAKEGNASKAISYSIKRAGDAFAYSAFALVIPLLYAALFLPSYALLFVNGLEIAGIILGTATILLGFYIAAKLSFLPIVMAVEDIKLKQALPNAWKWSGKRFFSMIIFLALVLMVWGIVNGIAINTLVAIDNNLLSISAYVVISAIGSAYAIIAMADYYNS